MDLLSVDGSFRVQSQWRTEYVGKGSGDLSGVSEER